MAWFSSVHLLSHVQLFFFFFSCPTLDNPMDTAHQASCPSPVPRVYSSSCPLSWWCHPAISILCCPLLLLPGIPPSIRVYSNESTLHMRWPKYWSFNFSISPSNEHPGLISFRMDWLDLLAVQGTVKSLFQHQSSKASILWHSAFCIVQLSHRYMTTGKTITLTRWTFVDNVMAWSVTLKCLALSLNPSLTISSFIWYNHITCSVIIFCFLVCLTMQPCWRGYGCLTMEYD